MAPLIIGFIFSILGLGLEAVAEWGGAALQRLALRANMSPPAVESVLRAEGPSEVAV